MIKVINVPSLYSAMYQAVEFCKINKNKQVEIIVPDKLSLFMEKFLFQELNICASFDIKVSTLNRFAKKCCDISKERQISKIGSLLLVHKILNENISSFEMLKSKTYSFAYAEEIFNTIAQLKASKINPEEMLEFSSKDKLLESKISDLAKVYSQYENQKAGLLDASDLFLMSSLFVGKDRQNQNLLFVGFEDFTAIEYSIIEQLAVKNNLSIITCFSGTKNSQIYNREIYEQLKNIALINQLPFEIENGNVYGDNLKVFLQSELFAIDKNDFILENINDLKLYACNSVKQEIERVARDIRLKIIDGKTYAGIGVAVYGLSSYEALIKEIFEKYDINYYLDSDLTLNKSIFYKFICNILRYNIESYNLAHLIDIINSPFFEINDIKKKELIEKLISIKFAGKLKREFCFGENLEEAKNALFNILECVTFSKEEDVTSFYNRIKRLDDNIGFERILCLLADKNLDLQNRLLLTKSKEVVFNVFDEILKFNPYMTIDDFVDVFFHVADVSKFNNLPLTIDAVKIVDADSQSEIFDDMFIINCTMEQAPKMKHDCGIILDSEIDKLNFKHKIAPSIAHINRLSKLKLFNLVTIFGKSLTITYSNNASEVVKELRNKIKIKLSAFEEVVNILPLEAFEFGEYFALTKWDYIDYLCKNDKDNLKIEENIIKNKEINNISRENLKIYNELKTVSASYLENYFRCPFSCFLRNVLKVKPRLDVEILSFDIGNMLHEIMFNYYKNNKQVGDVYEFCKNQVFDYVNKDDRLKINAKSPILTNLIDEAVRVVNGVDYIDKNSSFVPLNNMLEYSFVGRNALKLKNIDVIGKIDRVDKFDDMLRIVDYKSGSANATLRELYYGDKLQLFLYACAMENITNNKVVGGFYLPLHNEYKREMGNNYALNGFFLNEDFVVRAFDKRLQPNEKSDIVNVRMTKDGKARKSSGKELESDDLFALKEYSKKVSEQAVEEIKNGYIKASPSTVSDPCRYCEFSHICFKNVSGIKSRQVLDVDVSSFKEAQNG